MSDAETIERPVAATGEVLADGIYFEMPEAAYHSIPRLSASGIKQMCVSPATFWRGSWLDPNRPEPGEDDTKARILGRAYHCARLEPDDFEQRFCREPAKEDFAEHPNVVWNGTEIGETLAALGMTKKQAGETVVEQALRLEQAGFDGIIWPLVTHRCEEDRNGRTPIPARFWDDIREDMERIRDCDEIAELLSNGAAEVSVLWTDEHGIRMKSRLDYLTVGHWADFKTFDNTRGKVLDQAIADAFRYNRYYVQAAVHRDAVEAVRTGGLQVIGEATDEQRKLVAQLQIAPGELDCWYIFQEKGGIPNLIGRRFEFYDVPMTVRLNNFGASDEAQAAANEANRTTTLIFRMAMLEIDNAKRNFELYSQIYAPGQPWAPTRPLGTLGDADFSSGWLEGKWS
jgi:hypothetical protein